jgi:glycosyltransferase involved in cell wall biosynthesis
MRVAERSVLHVLPHPGGGGETYVDTLEAMPGYRFTRMHLAPDARPRKAAPALLRTAPRTNLSSRSHDLIHVHGEVAGALCLPALAARPSIVTLHGSHLVRRMHGLRRRAALANLRLVLAAADTTICVARSEYDQLAGAVGSLAAERAIVIRNGVELPPLPSDRERAAARAVLGAEESVTLLLWLGALDVPKEPEAAVRAAIRAARGGARLQLLLAGDGLLRDAVEDAARGEPGVVSVLGFRPDVRRLLAAADVFVLSSRREGLPFALLEAMATAIPAVVAANEGCVEALDETGIAVRQGDVAALAQAFDRLASDPGERERLGRLARERVAQHFRAETMIEQTRAVYEEVLRARS